ncbi:MULTISPECIES: hypothetical protein [unclassified Leptolyngbya]|uniref:hypothetical protein n=1 Tax=unclassified Leptolyngbya TaxID=2650499 RepID=UPI0016841CBE|nr:MULTISPECIES: hypothetical protein [unclassified Leptolyngbya]MBD1909495.1 hypothetical protein [Leptolyngbya sp. FACHB-8]MBD2159020.1 hypothetical protein [Leptolyngbya sp. FACHB-16]
MMISRSTIDSLKAQYAAEGRFGPMSDLFYLPDDILMEEYDAALLGSNHSYSMEDCWQEAIRRGLIAVTGSASAQPKFTIGLWQQLKLLKNVLISSTQATRKFKDSLLLRGDMREG